MTELLDDMGFDDVLAGNVYKAPEEAAVMQAPQHAERLPTSDGADAAASPLTVAVTAPDPIEQARLTPEGVQAAKALVALPPLDPPTLAKLARTVAMDIQERHTILAEFKLTQVQYDFLEAHNEFYKAALQAACIEWHAPLSTAERIKVEAAAILEESLPGLGARMQNKGEGLPGVIEAAKLFAKVAGVGERETSGAASGERFSINIDLGGDQKITVSTSPSEGPVAKLDRLRIISENPEA